MTRQQEPPRHVENRACGSRPRRPGQDHSFIISAPKGWVLDNQSGQSDGLQAVFYREGQTWSGASAVWETR